MLHVEVSHTSAVGNNALGPSGEPPINRQLPRTFPRIDAPFTGNNVLDPRSNRRLATISIGSEKPGVNDVGTQFTDVTLQPKITRWIKFPAFAYDRYTNASLAERALERPGVGQRGDVDIKLIARQPGGQEHELFLGAASYSIYLVQSPVIEAVALLKDRMPIVYTIVGNGDDVERLLGLATKLGVADRVVFAGVRQHEATLRAAAGLK